MMPSNLIDGGAQAERGAVIGARPPGQARSLLLAGRHGNETVHFGKGIRVPRPVGAISANGPSSGWGMSVIPPLSGDKQTFGERAKKRCESPKASSMPGCELRSATSQLSRQAKPSPT
jgi:hypothetical protein